MTQERSEGMPPEPSDTTAEFRQATDGVAEPARMRLDELLEELVERAGEVRATQGRLRSLLDAVIEIAGETSVSAALDQIVQAAAALVDARYAALGVVSTDHERLVDFITVGLTPDERRAIGDLPRGRGLLGQLLSDPRPIHLDDLTADPRSVGFPEHHPEMHSFLGVPIRVRDAVFGNLYLTEKRGEKSFTDEDAHLLVALATAAGIVIQNALLFDERQQQERWTAATAEVIAAALRGAEEQELFETVAAGALTAAASDRAVVLTPESDETLEVRAVVGVRAERIRGLRIPVNGSRVGEVMASGAPYVWSSPAAPAGVTWVGPGDETDFDAVVVAPLIGEGADASPAGVLAIAYERAVQWQVSHIDGFVTFARQTAVSLQLARSQSDRRRLAVMEDRERIARDLHDLVIQRIFATGMTLQSVLPLVVDPRAAQRISAATDDLDVTIRDVRQAIYHLQARHPSGLRAAVDELVSQVTDPVDGLSARLRVSGALDVIPPGRVSESLIAVLREALSNVVRHAEASEVKITVEVGDWLTLDVEDDGRGLGHSVERRSGLANFEHRAEELGGTSSLGHGRDGTGTHLTWSVPLTTADRARL